MNLEEFQNQSRLYVIGALDPEEIEEFERERKKRGKKAEDFVSRCYALHESFTLSLRPATVSALKERIMAGVRKCEELTERGTSTDIALNGVTHSRPD